MKADLWIGQRLRTTTNEYVAIVGIEDEYIYVRYRNKIYKRPKSIVGNKLFVVQDELSYTATPLLTKEPHKKSCENCLEMRKGMCFGQNGICGFFRYAPTIPQEEVDNWPKYGDATYFKMKRRRRQR